MTDCQAAYVELPLPPSVNSIWRQARGKVHKSKKYSDWITEAGLMLASQLKGKRVPGFVGIKIQCVKPDRRRRDISNLIKAAEDLLVSMRVIDDDSLVQRLEISWVPVGAPCQIWVISTTEVLTAK